MNKKIACAGRTPQVCAWLHQVSCITNCPLLSSHHPTAGSEQRAASAVAAVGQSSRWAVQMQGGRPTKIYQLLSESDPSAPRFCSRHLHTATHSCGSQEEEAERRNSFGRWTFDEHRIVQVSPTRSCSTCPHLARRRRSAATQFTISIKSFRLR